MITIPGKIPIRIHPIFWLLVFSFGWIFTENIQGAIAYAIVIFVSVLVHEFGHALTANVFGQSATIELVGLGGITRRRGPVLKFWQEFLIVLNGPLAGFAIYYFGMKYLSWSGLPSNAFLASVLIFAVYANLYWTIFNLLPIQPLDGGSLVSILLEKLFGLRGIKIALFISMISALAFSILAFLVGWFIAGAFLLMFMFESYRNWRGSMVVTVQDQDKGLQGIYKDAENDFQTGRQQDALEKLQSVRNAAGSGILYLSATQKIGDIYAQQGKYQEAFDVLAPIAKKLSPESLVAFQRVAFHLGHYGQATEIGKRAYQLQPGYESAYINALCSAVLGEKTPAIGWLQCALREGLPNPSQALMRHEFDRLRDEQAFQDLLKK